MTRVAMGHGWKIREIDGANKQVVISFDQDAPGKEYVLDIDHAEPFANRLLTICQNLRRGFKLDDIFEPLPARSDASDPGLNLHASNASPDASPPGPDAIPHDNERADSSTPRPDEPPRQASSWEPPGGLTRPPRTYKGGRRQRR